MSRHVEVACDMRYASPLGRLPCSAGVFRGATAQEAQDRWVAAGHFSAAGRDLCSVHR